MSGYRGWIQLQREERWEWGTCVLMNRDQQRSDILVKILSPLSGPNAHVSPPFSFNAVNMATQSRGQPQSQADLGLNPDATQCVTFANFLKLSKPQFPHL